MSTFYNANLVVIQATFTGLLLALSIQVPMRMGVFSFSGAGCYGLGAYVCGILVARYDVPAPLAIVAAVVGATIISFLLGALISGLTGLYLAMATVAFDLIISVVAINGGDFTGGSTGLYGVISDFTTGHLAVVALVALVLVALTELGTLGRRIDTVRHDPELALSMGIHVRWYRLAAFAASGALGAAGGAMNILVRSYVSPLEIGFPLIVLALTMIIVGGALSWRGAVIGALIFTWLPEVLTAIGEWQTLVYGVIVAVAAVMLPGGLYGLWTDLRRLWVSRKHQITSGPQAALASAGNATGSSGDQREEVRS